MNVATELANIEETLALMARQLAKEKQLDAASETLDVAVLVCRLKRKVKN